MSSTSWDPGCQGPLSAAGRCNPADGGRAQGRRRGARQQDSLLRVEADEAREGARVIDEAEVQAEEDGHRGEGHAEVDLHERRQRLDEHFEGRELEEEESACRTARRAGLSAEAWAGAPRLGRRVRRSGWRRRAVAQAVEQGQQVGQGSNDAVHRGRVLAALSAALQARGSHAAYTSPGANVDALRQCRPCVCKRTR